MQSEMRKLFESTSSVKYEYTADCTPDQEKKGEYFYVDLGTTFEEPEIIDSLFFYNYFDSMSDEEKERYRKDFCDGPDRDHPIIGGWCDDYYPVKK